MRRFIYLSLLLIAALKISTLAQTTPDALIGTWTGQAHYGGESKLIALRFELNKKGTRVLFFDIPDLKFRNMGPIPVTQQGEQYKASEFSFRLAGDKSITGTLSFDGHDLPFKLEPGSLPAAPAAAPPAGPVATPVWTFKTGDAIWSSPAIAENTVYFGSNDGMIYAVSAKDGKEVWRFKTGGRVLSCPTLVGPHLYALSDDGYLYKLDRRSAKLVWKFDTHGGDVAREFPSPASSTYDYLTSAASISDGTVFIGSADKKLYAVDADTGQEKWHFETKGIIRSTPVVAAGLVFIGSYDHNVYAVDAATGALRWQHDTLKEVVSSPLIVDSTIYIGSRSSDLFAFDAVTGKIKWKFFYWSSWVESSARMRDGILYIGSSDYQLLFAIDAKAGKRVWNVNLDGSVWSTPAVTNRSVYVGVVGVVNYFIEHRGGFFAVDRITGKIAWRFPMSVVPGAVDYGVASSPAVGHGMVFFGGLDGTFYAFKESGSE
jgi:outer membrane protein assembly factor BamB